MKEAAAAAPADPTSCLTRSPPNATPQIKVAVASGIGHARHLLQKVEAGEAHYDFVEVRCWWQFVA